MNSYSEEAPYDSELFCCMVTSWGALVFELMRRRDIKSLEFDDYDASLVAEGVGRALAGRTIIGRHVFIGKIDYEGIWDSNDITPELNFVLKKYDDAADELGKNTRMRS